MRPKLPQAMRLQDPQQLLPFSKAEVLDIPALPQSLRPSWCFFEHSEYGNSMYKEFIPFNKDDILNAWVNLLGSGHW